MLEKAATKSPNYAAIWALTVKFHIKMACLKLGIIPTSAIKLAIYLNCELFRIGLRELGYL